MKGLDDIKIGLEDKLRAYLDAEPELEEIRKILAKPPEGSLFEKERKRKLKEAVELTERTHPVLFGIFHTLFDRFAISPNLALFKEKNLASENAVIMVEGNEIIVSFCDNILNLIDDQKELTGIIGHELGHYLFGHCGKITIVEKLLAIETLGKAGEVLPAYAKRFLKSRRMAELLNICSLIKQVAELNADRVGLLACNDFSATVIASAKLSAGPVDKFGIYDPQSYLLQAERLIATGDYFSEQDLNRSHPYEPLRAKALEFFYYSDAYCRLVGGGEPRCALAEFDELLPGILPLRLAKVPKGVLQPAAARRRIEPAKAEMSAIVVATPVVVAAAVQAAVESAPASVAQGESAPAQETATDSRACNAHDKFLIFSLADVFAANKKRGSEEDAYYRKIFRHCGDLDEVYQHIEALSDAEYEKMYEELRAHMRTETPTVKKQMVTALLNAARADNKVTKAERAMIGTIAGEIDALAMWHEIEDNVFGMDIDRATKIVRLGIKREDGYLYWVNKQGDVCRGKGKIGPRGGIKTEAKDTEVLAEKQVQREQGYLYFIDTEGDIARTVFNDKEGEDER